MHKSASVKQEVEVGRMLSMKHLLQMKLCQVMTQKIYLHMFHHFRNNFLDIISNVCEIRSPDITQR